MSGFASIGGQHAAVRQLSAAAALNTRLFRNCLAGVSDADATRRPNDRVNSLGFVACHVLEARHFTAGYLGLSHSNPLEWVLANAESIDDVPVLPELDDVLSAWSTVSADVEACLASLGPRDLSMPSPQRFPIPDATIGGGIEFQLHHESYHIGQLAYLRKFLGYPAMSYR